MHGRSHISNANCTKICPMTQVDIQTQISSCVGLLLVDKTQCVFLQCNENEMWNFMNCCMTTLFLDNISTELLICIIYRYDSYLLIIFLFYKFSIFLGDVFCCLPSVITDDNNII